MRFEVANTNTTGFSQAPATVHGTSWLNQIRVTFSNPVYVDCYDLRLLSTRTNGYHLAAEGFSYDPVERTASWNLDFVEAIQTNMNERFEATISGVFEPNGTPLFPGPFTTNYTVLTGDVDGNEAGSPTGHAARPLG